MAALSRVRIPEPRVPDDMIIENVTVPGPASAPRRAVAGVLPRSAATPVPVLYWIHGGGFVMGWVEQDEKMLVNFARTLGIVVVSVDYRLSPQHRAPSALDDAYAGFDVGVRRGRCAPFRPGSGGIGGASAGGDSPPG